MTDLSVKYMGFKLASPLILGSCGLTNSIDKLKKAEESGFGAVVLKSVFEEQVVNEVSNTIQNSHLSTFKQAYDYISQYQEMASSEKYLGLVREAVGKLSIPVIASINCASDTGWINYAKAIQDAGANALEVNYFVLPYSFDKDANHYIKSYLKLIDALLNTVTIPVALKVSTYFTDMAYSLQKFSYTGIKSLVIFNRFHSPDINIDDLRLTASNNLSHAHELNNTIRWTGILSGNLRCDLSATTGVHDSSGLIKLLLAGATTVQAASVFYEKGIDYGATMLLELKEWMGKHEFSKISDFNAKLNFKNIEDKESYFRIQFMKYMAGIE